MCLRLICPFLKLRAWWVAKRSEVLCCEGSPGQSNVQLATGKGKEAEVMGYERHGQGSCSIGLVTYRQMAVSKTNNVMRPGLS